MSSLIKQHRGANYLKTHRKRSGLTQREVGTLLGYKDPGQISRHERATSTPPLEAALAYEVIFRVPIAVIFLGIRDAIARDVDARLADLAVALRSGEVTDANARMIAQKVAWLQEQQKRGAKN